MDVSHLKYNYFEACRLARCHVDVKVSRKYKSAYSLSYVDVDAATLTPNLGELCQGQDVVLTCSTTLRITNMGGIMDWFYNGVSLTTLGFSTTDPINTTREAMVSGFMSLVLTSRMPEFATTLSFRADCCYEWRQCIM